MVKTRQNCRAVITYFAIFSWTGYGSDYSIRGYSPDASAIILSKINTTIRSERYSGGTSDSCFNSRPAIAAMFKFSITGYCSNNTIRADPSDTIISPISDIDASIRADRYSMWKTQFCLGRRAIVSAISICSSTNYCSNYSSSPTRRIRLLKVSDI